MTRYNGWTPSYDANNHIVGWPYDAAGNMLSNGYGQMHWDAESRISAVTGASYLYDAMGNRVESNSSSASYTVYFGGRPVARLQNGQWTDLIYGPTGLLAEVPGQEYAKRQYRVLTTSERMSAQPTPRRFSRTRSTTTLSDKYVLATPVIPTSLPVKKETQNQDSTISGLRTTPAPWEGSCRPAGQKS